MSSPRCLANQPREAPRREGSPGQVNCRHSPGQVNCRQIKQHFLVLEVVGNQARSHGTGYAKRGQSGVERIGFPSAHIGRLALIWLLLEFPRILSSLSRKGVRTETEAPGKEGNNCQDGGWALMYTVPHFLGLGPHSAFSNFQTNAHKLEVVSCLHFMVDKVRRKMPSVSTGCQVTNLLSYFSQVVGL